jgi:hypothetical protein
MAPERRAKLNVDLVDVHILDITAHLEALLRAVSEVQRDVLRVRGGATAGVASRAARMAAANDALARLTRMLNDCEGLKDAVSAAAEHASALRSAAEIDDE